MGQTRAHHWAVLSRLFTLTVCLSQMVVGTSYCCHYCMWLMVLWFYSLLERLNSRTGNAGWGSSSGTFNAHRVSIFLSVNGGNGTIWLCFIVILRKPFLSSKALPHFMAIDCTTFRTKKAIINSLHLPYPNWWYHVHRSTTNTFLVLIFATLMFLSCIFWSIYHQK